MILRTILTIGLATLLTLLLCAPGRAEVAPSWCKYARSETEQTICSTSHLWGLDACLNQLYSGAQKSAAPSDRKKIEAAEDTWIGARDRCGSDTDCIARHYQEQISRLDPSKKASCTIQVAQSSANQPSKPSNARPVTPSCDIAAVAAQNAAGVTVTSRVPKEIPYGGRIEINWQLPNIQPSAVRYFLIGAMLDGVRFEGEYRYDEYNFLKHGPGFLAVPSGSRAPYGIRFGSERTRVIIPIDDTDVDRSGRLWVKSYIGGPLTIEWAVIAIAPGCAGSETRFPVASLGPYEVAAGTPRIIVQDFITPDPRLALETSSGTQHLKEIGLSADGRYRMEIFERRYRVFDRASGAMIVDRSGVQPRFSPAGRFVIASVGDVERTFPTNFELIDLIVGKSVRSVTGPIVGWSNGDALLIDARRAYQSVSLIGTLIDPDFATDGSPRNAPGFYPGCGSCDAWASSNIFFDWDRLMVLRGDSDAPSASGVIGLATGRKFDAASFEKEKSGVETLLKRNYGQSKFELATGWTSNATLKLTHVGRGYEGYIDGNPLKPSQAGRASQTDYLAPRRLALADGRVLLASDIRPTGATRGKQRAAWGTSSGGHLAALNKGYIADELAKLGLQLAPASAVSEIPIPESDGPWGSNPVIRTWPSDLKAEVLAAAPTLKSWFRQQPDDTSDVIVAAWRFELQGIRYLLLQHGDPAMTMNGAHSLSFDLVPLNGPSRGQLHTFKEISGLYSQFVSREHTIARVMTKGSNQLIIAIPGSGKAAIVAFDNNFTASIIDMVEPTLLCGFYSNASRGLLLQNNCDGQFFLYDPAAARSPILSARVVDEELIAYNAQGYYAATYEGAHFVHIAFPGLPGVHSFEQFAKVLNRPDFVRDIIGGTRSKFPTPALLPPPSLELARGVDTAEGLTLAVDVSSDSGLSRLEFYVDGRFEKTHKISGTHVKETISLPRRAYARSVTAVALDNDHFRSRPVTIEMQTKPGAKNTLYVEAIGIDEYDHLNRLQGAKFDAETLVTALKSSSRSYYHDVKATMRANRAATAAVVWSDLQAKVDAAGPDDTILVFFAGHGGKSDDGRYFMATSATDPKHLPETAINWSSMSDLLSKARGRVIVVIDACHSGQTERTQITNDQMVSSLTTTSNAPMVIFAASKGRQFSEEIPGKGGGVFTQNLARLLGPARKDVDTNRDGVLEISELYRNLKHAVTTMTRGRQTPWLVRQRIVGDAPLF